MNPQHFSVFDCITQGFICQSPFVHNQQYGQLANYAFVQFYNRFRTFSPQFLPRREASPAALLVVRRGLPSKNALHLFGSAE